MITRERQIQLALAILKPTDRDKGRADIVATLDIVDSLTAVSQNDAFLSSRSGRLKVQALQRALKQVRIAYEALPDTGRANSVRARVGDIDLQKHLDACDAILKSPPSRRTSYGGKLSPANRHRLAAGCSHYLLLQYNIPQTVTRKKGAWYRLAAIVYGDPEADLFTYLREIKGRLEKKPP